MCIQLRTLKINVVEIKKNNLMKKIQIFIGICAIALFFTSCQEEKSKTELEHVNKSAYMIDVNDDFYDLIYNDNGYTFKEIDQFYREIKESRKNDLNYNNLRKIIISTMYLSNGLKDNEDKKIVEYYVNELISMPYVSDMELFYQLLSKLENYWSKDQIKSTAETIVTRNSQYIRKNFPDPDKILNLPHQASGLMHLTQLALLS
jgi:hypothetical protein